MEAIYIQQGCANAIKNKTNMSTHLPQKEKTEMVNIVKNTTILCLRDKTFKKVMNERIVMSMLYMTKPLI